MEYAVNHIVSIVVIVIRSGLNVLVAHVKMAIFDLFSIVYNYLWQS